MDLARIERHPTIKDAEIRSFECPVCQRTLRKTFGALK
jgi:hypothetical protein